MNAPRKLPESLETNRLLERWLRINRDGTVTVYTGKVEFGQGILTAIAQVAGDEFDVALERIRLVPADTVHSPDEGITSGSRSIEESAIALQLGDGTRGRGIGFARYKNLGCYVAVVAEVNV